MARASRSPVLAARLSSQLLTDPTPDGVLAAVGRITAVQAQDPRGFRLAVRARTAGGGASDVDRALTEDRSLVVDWLCRGTLHLVRSEDHHWLHALTAPRQATSNARRLQQEGVDAAAAERGVAAVSRAVREDGPRTRVQLREVLEAAGVRTEGQALIHVLGLASLRGLLLRGPVVDGEQAFADPESWLGPRPSLPDRDVLLSELARRYLAGHGPASDRDLAAWSGLPLGDARRGLAGVRGLVDLGDSLLSLGTGRTDRLPAPRLLGPFDPVLHGWASRDLVVPAGGVGVVTDNGLFRPTALVDGRTVATWRWDAGRPAWTPLDGQTIGPAAQKSLERDAEALTTWLAR